MPATGTKKRALDVVRELVKELAERKPAFYTTDVYNLTAERRGLFSEPIFAHGHAGNYSERIEACISLLLLSRELLVNPFNSCQLVTPDSLAIILEQRKQMAAAQ